MRKKTSFFGFLVLGIAGLILCPGRGEAFPTIKWTFSGHNEILDPDNFEIWAVPGSPAIGHDGTIYAGSLNGYFFAIQPDGDLKWVNKELGGAFGYTPALADDDTVYTTNGHVLYALDPDDGSIEWSHHADCLFLGAPAVAQDGTIYIGSNSSRLYAFTPEGTIKWEFHGVLIPTGGEFGVFGNPVIGAYGTIYCVQNIVEQGSVIDGALYAIDPSGQTSSSLGMNMLRTDLSLAIGADGSLYAAAYNGRLYCISPQDWSTKWSYLMQGSTPTGSPVIGADGTIYAAYWNNLAALASDGSLRWSSTAPANLLISTPAVGANGVVYFGTFGTVGGAFVGQICALQTTGSLYWDLWMEGQVHSSPAIVMSGNQGVLTIGCEKTVRAWVVDSLGTANSMWPVDRCNLKRNARVPAIIYIKHIWKLIEYVKIKKYPDHRGDVMIAKLEAARRSLEKNDTVAAKKQLKAFIAKVNSLKGKKFAAPDAEGMVLSAKKIVDFL